jgi:hypothetical protein
MKIAVGMDVHAKRSSAYAVYAGIGEIPGRHEKFLREFNREFEDFPSTCKWLERMSAFVSKHECYVLIESSKDAPSLGRPPLRTVRTSFPVHGSSRTSHSFKCGCLSSICI